MSTNPVGVPGSRLKLQIQAAPESTLVICSGKLTWEVAAEFKQEIRALLPQTKRIALDLNEVVLMDSSGLGAIVGVYVTAKNTQCELQLVNLSNQIRDLLGATNLLSVFQSADNAGPGRCESH